MLQDNKKLATHSQKSAVERDNKGPLKIFWASTRKNPTAVIFSEARFTNVEHSFQHFAHELHR